jgi:hypothetical protein
MNCGDNTIIRGGPFKFHTLVKAIELTMTDKDGLVLIQIRSDGGKAFLIDGNVDPLKKEVSLRTCGCVSLSPYQGKKLIQ